MEYEVLKHHGIRGMRWGVRRYQNKDGSLTAKGKKRYASEMEKLNEREKTIKNKLRTKAKMDKLEAKRKAVEEQEALLKGKKKASTEEPKVEASKKDAKPKTINDMSDQELQSVVLRLRNEKAFSELTSQEPKVSKGKQFVDGMFEKAVLPAFEEVGKEILKRGLGKATEDIFKDTKNHK